MIGTPVILANRFDIGSGTGTVTATVTDVASTVGATVFAVVRAGGGTRPTGVVDSKGRQFAQVAAAGTTMVTVTVFALAQTGGVALGVGDTVATVGDAVQPQLVLFEIDGAGTVDQAADATKAANSTAALTIPATNPTSSGGQVAITCVAQAGLAAGTPYPAPSVTAGWTALNFAVGTAALNVAAQVAWQPIPAVGPVGPVTWTPAGLINLAGLTVTYPPLPALEITTTGLPDATVGQPYSAALQAEGGFPPYTWAVTAGDLPAGLALDPNTGVISGTPTEPT